MAWCMIPQAVFDPTVQTDHPLIHGQTNYKGESFLLWIYLRSGW